MCILYHVCVCVARDYKLDLSVNLGKSKIVGGSAEAGYYCSLCDCVLKDSTTYLHHINGKYHQRALGMSMRVERSTADQVKERLNMHKQKASQAKTDENVNVMDGFEAKVKQAEEEERRAREEMKRKKRQEARRAGEAEEGEEEEWGGDEMAKMMGFAAFGGG